MPTERTFLILISVAVWVTWLIAQGIVGQFKRIRREKLGPTSFGQYGIGDILLILGALTSAFGLGWFVHALYSDLGGVAVLIWPDVRDPATLTFRSLMIANALALLSSALRLAGWRVLRTQTGIRIPAGKDRSF